MCPSNFSRSDHLNAHMKKHDKERPYKCQFCNLFYRTVASLTSHTQFHKRNMLEKSSEKEAQKNFKCLICEKTFATAAELKIHYRIHNQANGRRRGKYFSCRFCQRTFPSTIALEKHVEKMHALETKGKCPICLEEFSTLEALVEHKKSHEDSQAPSRFSCTWCRENEFPSFDLLQKHIQETHLPIGSNTGSSTAASSSSPWSNPRATPDAPNQKSSPLESVIQCYNCTMCFDNPTDLTKHIETAHGSYAEMKSSGYPMGNCFRGFPQCKDHDRVQVQQDPGFLLRNPQVRSKSSSPRHNPMPDVYMNNQFYYPRYPVFPGPFICNQCPEAFVDFESFKEHQKCIHLTSGTTSTPYSCLECDGKFPTQELLDQHMTSHYLASSVEYECQNCKRTFIEPELLQRHLLEAHSQQLHQCAVCKDVFESKLSLQLHFSSVHSCTRTTYSCKLCHLIFKTEAESFSHVKLIHLTKQLKFRCNFCNLTYESNSQLQSHFMTHRSFTCRFCREEFHMEFLLNQHIRDQHPEGSSPSLLPSEGDMVQNLSTKPRMDSESFNSLSKIQLRCDMCDTSFTAESSLNVHRRQVHNIRVSGSQKPGQTTLSLNCAYCSETCKNRNELENHMKIHNDGSSKHKCNICDEMFPSAATLSEHKLAHCKIVTNNTCVTCHTTLKFEEHFHAHLYQHNPQGLPASCVICRQTLMSEIDVQVHARYHLKETDSLYPCCVCRRKYIKDEQIVSGKEANQTYMCKDCYHGNNFKCVECNIKFESMSELEKHKSSHKNVFQCITCQQNYDNVNKVEAHVKLHLLQDGRTHLCHICNKIYDSPAKLQCHLITHTYEGSSIYHCYLCRSVFSEPYLIQQHMLEHCIEKKPFECPFCNHKFFFRAELDNHSFSHVPKPNQLQGTNNGQDFLSSKRFEATSKPPVQGSTKQRDSSCAEELNSSGDMQKHQFKEHSDSKLQNSKKVCCPDCNKTFPCHNTMQRHRRVHSVGKMFTCSECRKEFQRAENLTIHMRIHTGEKLYNCEVCNKTFARKDSRKAHMKTHSDEKLSMFPHCKKTFAKNSHATEQMRIHITSTTHPCELCSENFPSSAEHKRHLAEAHSKIFAYNCSVCNEMFESSEALDQHLRENHKVENSRDDSVDDDLSKSSLGHTSSSNNLKDSDSSIDNSNMDESDARDSPLSIEEGNSHLENHIPTPQTVA
ncbi:hypothetical protein TNCV_576901 [Trichonephila clavipes]|nr:hypothetical protein TNCV_576901 [Trichonephila clavipes]